MLTKFSNHEEALVINIRFRGISSRKYIEGFRRTLLHTVQTPQKVCRFDLSVSFQSPNFSNFPWLSWKALGCFKVQGSIGFPMGCLVAEQPRPSPHLLHANASFERPLCPGGDSVGVILETSKPRKAFKKALLWLRIRSCCLPLVVTQTVMSREGTSGSVHKLGIPTPL